MSTLELSRTVFGKYHLGFPLKGRSGPQGRARFGGGGRGLGYTEIVDVVRTYGGFEEVPAVWGGNKQTAQSPHNPEWMASEAVAFIRRAAAAAAKAREAKAGAKAAGGPLTDAARGAMQKWLDAKQVRHGGHRVALADFGLSEEGVQADPVFRRYCKEYSVPGC